MANRNTNPLFVWCLYLPLMVCLMFIGMHGFTCDSFDEHGVTTESSESADLCACPCQCPAYTENAVANHGHVPMALPHIGENHKTLFTLFIDDIDHPPEA